MCLTVIAIAHALIVGLHVEPVHPCRRYEHIGESTTVAVAVTVLARKTRRLVVISKLAPSTLHANRFLGGLQTFQENIFL